MQNIKTSDFITMKKIGLYLMVLLVAGLAACKKDNYPGGVVSPIIALIDLRAIYKGADVVLNEDNMGGANQMVGVVITQPSAGNAPAGLLVVQNERRFAIRGISLDVGSATAAKFTIGDSVIINVAGGTLTKVNGSLRLTGINESAITKVSSNAPRKVRVVPGNQLIANPDLYESTLISISNAVTEPEAKPGDTFAGNKVINDGFAKVVVHTETSANFASRQLPPSANFTGIAFVNSTNADIPVQIWPRVLDDTFELPLIRPSAFVISGYLTDPLGAAGSDANYEYIQFIATRDIDFAATPFSVVTNNNAGATAAPAQGWATGGARTYKFNLTTGTVKKGQYFYIGGNKNIWGAGSTDISSAIWINSTLYSNVAGAGFGTATTNLLANSGNVAGIAVFAGTTVDATSVPLDVVMYGGNGPVYAAGPPEVGYRITNTDYYTTINPATRSQQGFYGGGTNTSKLVLPATANWSALGGVYDAKSGRWPTGRTVTSIPLSPTSQLDAIESSTGTGFTKLVN
jgi:hypothetical protein